VIRTTDYTADATAATLKASHRVVQSILDRDASQLLCRADFHDIGTALKKDLGRLV